MTHLVIFSNNLSCNYVNFVLRLSSMERASGSSIPPHDSDQRLCYYRRRQVSFAWPEAVHARLGELVDLAHEAGANTGLAEMSAALVAFTELDGEALCNLVIKYRKTTVGDFMEHDPPEAD